MSPLLISGLVLALLGLLFGRVFVANFELSTRGKVVKTVGVLAVVIGALLALRGAELIGSAAPTDTTGGTTWGDDPVAAEADARARKLPLLVDFSADWCKACKELEVLTFSSPEISERLKGWVTARVDLTHDRPELADLQKRFKVQGLPTVAFVTPDGKVLDALTLTGFEDAAAFGKRLDQAESGGAGIAVDESLAGRIRRAFEAGSAWVYLLVFLAGVVGSLSPCVYPLIPITISLFGAREAKSRMSGFLLSLVYVAGITVTYSALGVTAATTGGLFGAALQSGWVIGTVSLTFMAMGLSMIGVFDLRLPDGLNQRMSSVGGQGSGQFLGAFLMGTVAGIVAAPCVGPPLVAVLAFVAKQQSVSLGLSLLSVYSLGMGMLFIFLGTFTHFIGRMPKSGGWMEVVKGSLGIMMLLVGLVYLQDLVPVLP